MNILRFACGATLETQIMPDFRKTITISTLPSHQGNYRKPQLNGEPAPCMACPLSDRKAGRKCIWAYEADSPKRGIVCTCKFTVETP